MSATYTLRNMPGVADVEARRRRIFSGPDAGWHPEYPGLDEHTSAVAKNLFGIDERDVRESDARGMIWIEQDAWDPMIELIESSGWDLRREDGELLSCARSFLPMIVLAMEGKMGRLPEPGASRTLSDGEAERLAEKLRAETAAWRRERSA